MLIYVNRKFHLTLIKEEAGIRSVFQTMIYAGKAGVSHPHIQPHNLGHILLAGVRSLVFLPSLFLLPEWREGGWPKQTQ